MSTSFFFRLAFLAAAVTASIDKAGHVGDDAAESSQDNRRNAKTQAWQFWGSSLPPRNVNLDHAELDRNVAIFQRRLDREWWRRQQNMEFQGSDSSEDLHGDEMSLRDKFGRAFTPNPGSLSDVTHHEHDKPADLGSGTSSEVRKTQDANIAKVRLRRKKKSSCDHPTCQAGHIINIIVVRRCMKKT
jgi:hypothetical protein